MASLGDMMHHHNGGQSSNDISKKTPNHDFVVVQRCLTDTGDDQIDDDQKLLNKHPELVLKALSQISDQLAPANYSNEEDNYCKITAERSATTLKDQTIMISPSMSNSEHF